jgi:2-alkenal reductase
MNPVKGFIVVISVLVLAGIACQSFTAIPTPAETIDVPVLQDIPQQTALPPVLIPPAADLVALEDSLMAVYEKVNPGVVSLRILTEQGGSLGSGFVFDELGHIITNYHVVEDVTDMEVAFPSGVKTRAEVIGKDLDSDIAVIKVTLPESDLYPLSFSDSDTVRVGQAVIAIGNPFGFRGTMTMGIVSGLGRTMQSLHEVPGGGMFSAGDIIQTDAAINPGNSGGPLLNLQGEVVGVNRAIFTTNFSDSGDPLNSGLGFAISINIVKRVVPSLIANGKYDYPYVGITSLNDLSLLEVEALGLPQATGVYVNKVTPDGPADQAGIIGGNRATSIFNLNSGGDLITAIDDVEVQTFADFISYLIKYKSPGDVVVLTVLRNGKIEEVPVRLEKRPDIEN